MQDKTLVTHAKQLKSLFALFPPGDDMPEYEFVASDEVPAPYHRLLVHEHHMTVTVEDVHRDRVNIRVLARTQEPDWYARKILLTLESTDRPVQFGIMRIQWRHCPGVVRDEVLGGRSPLGRILINHNVLRRIESKAYLRVLPGKAMMDWFGADKKGSTYGRLAVIHCNGEPAIDLVEIVAPS